MESFNALLQANVLDRQPWATRDELHNAIVVRIERTYNLSAPPMRPRQNSPGRVRTRLHGNAAAEAA